MLISNSIRVDGENIPEECKQVNEQFSVCEDLSDTETQVEKIEEVENEIKYIDYEVPSGDTSFKTYTYYKSINRQSEQWCIQTQATTDSNGLRKIGEYYLVAMGSYYSSTLGDKFLITLDTGCKIPVIICDVKDDKHTNSTNQYKKYDDKKNILEFYVAENLNYTAKQLGDISAIECFKGNIVKIQKEVNNCDNYLQG